MARAEPIAQHGWFPDPEEPGRLRMWDGKGWTSLTKYPSAGDEIGSGPAPSGPLPPKPSPRPAPSYPSGRPSPTARAVEPAAASPSAEQATERSSDRITEPADAPAATVISTNIYSVLTLGLALVYILVASTTGFVVIGVVPVLLAARAFGVREPMAPFAGLAAAAAVIIGLVLLAR